MWGRYPTKADEINNAKMLRVNNTRMAENDPFWTAVDDHRRVILHDLKISTVRKLFQNEIAQGSVSVTSADACHPDIVKKKFALGKIESCVRHILEMVGNEKAPVLSYSNTRSWENIQFEDSSGMQMMQDARKTHVRFDSPSSTRKFSLILKVLSIMYRLIQTDSFCTKRDIYYQDTVLFASQSVVDNVVANISCMLAIPRWELHVLATSKGCVAGDLKFQDADGNYFDCSATPGLLIPSHVNGIRNLTSQAKFVLVVEKDASFQKLIDDDFCNRLYPCILITGKGFPDINTRLLLRKLWEGFAIPIFALVDADPHGMEIMAVYRYGSLALAYESHHLTVPAIRWLGVFPSDIERFNIPQSMLIPVTAADKNKAKELLVRPYIASNQIWYHELQVILQSGVKAEIQSLTAISPRFLSDTYIPGKLQQGGWI